MANVVFLVILSKFFFIIENKAVGTSLKIPVIAPRPHLKMRAIAPLLRGLWRPLAALLPCGFSAFQTLCKSRGNNGRHIALGEATLLRAVKGDVLQGRPVQQPFWTRIIGFLGAPRGR